MTGDHSGFPDRLDPLAAVLRDAAALDALAGGERPPGDDRVLMFLTALRHEIDASVAAATSPEVRRDAALLDALAAGAGFAISEPALGLLSALRAAVDGVTVEPAPVADPEPVRLPAPAAVPAAAPSLGSLGSRRRRRALRTGVAAGSVALALSMSGVAAAAYDSHPGGSLYGLRTQTFGRTDDDPVAAQEVLAALKQETAAAVSTPGDATVVARARADYTHLQHLVSAERRDPRAQQSIAASASTVATALAVLPVAPATPASRSPRRIDAAGRPTVHAAATRPAASGHPPAPAVVLTPAPAPSVPDASPGAAVTASPATTTDPTGTPTTSGSPTTSPSPSAPTSGTPDPSGSPSEDPSASASSSDSASASTSPRPSGSPSEAVTTYRSASPVRSSAPVRTSVAVRTPKPKARPAKKKKPVTATLMTAQLPTSGVTQR